MNRILVPIFLTISRWVRRPMSPALRILSRWMICCPYETRIATGAAGPDYWQQQVDYHIKVTVDDEKQRLSGWEEITYYNQSPHNLEYLWVQLDQNAFPQGLHPVPHCGDAQLQQILLPVPSLPPGTGGF